MSYIPWYNIIFRNLQEKSPEEKKRKTILIMIALVPFVWGLYFILTPESRDTGLKLLVIAFVLGAAIKFTK